MTFHLLRYCFHGSIKEHRCANKRWFRDALACIVASFYLSSYYVLFSTIPVMDLDFQSFSFHSLSLKKVGSAPYLEEIFQKLQKRRE